MGPQVLPYLGPWAKATPPLEENRAERTRRPPYLWPWAKATPPQEENRAVRTRKPQEKEWRRLQRRKPRPQKEELKNVDAKRSVLRCRRTRVHWSGNGMC